MTLRKTLATIGVAGALTTLAPIDGEAGGPTGGTWSRGYSGYSTRAYPHPYYSRPYSYRPHYYRPYAYRPYAYLPYVYPPYYSYSPLSFYAPPAYVVTAPGSYYYSAPPGAYSLPTAPQIEREVVFPEGRYLLEGDGDTVPYRWVWVPNLPTAPPAPAQDRR